MQSLAPFYYEKGADAVRQELLLLAVHDMRTHLDDAADARTAVLDVGSQPGPAARRQARLLSSAA